MELFYEFRYLISKGRKNRKFLKKNSDRKEMVQYESMEGKQRKKVRKEKTKKLM